MSGILRIHSKEIQCERKPDSQLQPLFLCPLFRGYLGIFGLLEREDKTVSNASVGDIK
jgi:hypothetical protein